MIGRKQKADDKNEGKIKNNLRTKKLSDALLKNIKLRKENKKNLKKKEY